MKRLSILFLFLGLFCTASVFAQSLTITGTVSDAEEGFPIPGVTVLVKGTQNGAQTDFDGNYTLNNVNANDIIVISYVGYVTQEINVGSRSTINVQLTTDVAQLGEVVVIGYGKSTKKELTGSVGIVDAEVIEDLKPTRIEQALQGQVAGVNITAQSGAPGSNSNIRIRGISTNGDNRPLILLDGNVIEDLSVVNPGDIESLTVLKDATAGIYGVRAANGVILITTKSGRKNTPVQWEYDAYAGFQTTTRKIPLLNATEYALLRNEAAAANGESLVFPDVSQLGEGTNWQDEVFQTAPIFNHNLNVRGGTEKMTYSAGASLLTQDGIVGGSKANFTRYTSRLNLTYDPMENLNLKANLLYSGTLRKTLPEGGLGSVLFNALNVSPTVPAYNEDGSFGRAVGHPIEVVNPLAQTASTFNRTQVDKISGVFGASYSFLKNFKASVNYQWNYAEVRGKSFAPILDLGDEGVSDTVFDNLQSAVVNEQVSYFRDYTFDAFFEYSKVFNVDHDVNILLGTSVFKTTGDFQQRVGIDVNATNLSNANVDDAETIANPTEGVNNSFDARLLSYFVRGQYNFQGKYFFSGVVRRDGSTKFGPENKFGIFPSVSVGWVASEEEFLVDNNAIDFLKFRASYGIIGNDRIGDFRFVSVLNGEGVYVFNDELVFGQATGPISNPEIKWEEQKTFDVGLDLNLFNKVSITSDYFSRRTDDLLLEVPSSGTLGSSAPGARNPIVNAGTVRNRGFEFKIGYKDDISKDFGIDLSYNFTTLDNEVLEVTESTDFVEGGSFGIGQDLAPSRMQVGQPIGVFYGYQTNGIFQNQDEVDAHPSQIALGANAQPGDIRFVDTNGDGVLNTDDRTFIGDPIPDITMGLNLAFNYKQFDFQTYFFSSIGNDIVRNYDRNDPVTNRTTFALNRWTGPGSTNTDPRVTTGATTNFVFSDYFVEDGSFVRAQNMQLGYTLSDKAIKNIGIDKLRIYTSISNVFTLTKYRGFDATANNGAPIGGGIDGGFYPNPRTFLLGANLKF